jgi:hypothetical protein
LRIGCKKPFFYLKQKLAGSRLYYGTKTLGSAANVHWEILNMFRKKFGKIPSKWIYNYAHVIARESGLQRENPENNLNFVKKLVSVSIATSFRLRYYIPISELKTLAGWYLDAKKSLKQGNCENRI